MKPLRTVAFLLVLGVVFAATARAQLFLENGKEVLAVSGGEHLTGSLLIHNTSKDPATIRVYWEDFEYKPPYDGSKNFLPAGTAPGSASQWVTFTPQTFSMPAFGQQTVDYTVTVPSEIHEGHYGVLFFEKSSDLLTPDNGGVTLVTRVGCLFFIEPKDKVKKADINNVAYAAGTVTADFANQGNVTLIPRTTYYVMQNDGLVLLRGETKKLYVPAGVSAHLEIPVKKTLSPGKYTLVINSDLGEGDVAVKEVGVTVGSDGQLEIESV